MKYWGGRGPQSVSPGPPGSPPASNCFAYPALFAYDDATCGTWSDLFSALLDVQGIQVNNGAPNKRGLLPKVFPDAIPGGSGYVLPWGNNGSVAFANFNYDFNQLNNGLSPNALIQIKPLPSEIHNISTGRGLSPILLVKEWDRQDLTNHKFIRSDYYDAAQTIQTNPTQFQQPPDIKIVNAQGAVSNVIPSASMAGIPAQGNTNPVSEFTNHAVNKIGSKIYDPSYGTPPSSSEAAYEASSFNAFGVRFIASIPGRSNTAGFPIQTVVIYTISLNPSNNEVEFN